MKKTAIIFVVIGIIISGYTINGMNIQAPTTSQKSSVALPTHQLLMRKQKEKKKKAQAATDKAKNIMQIIVRDPISVGCYGATAVVLAAYAYIKITS